jgi:redox-sensitive bicupin YhaK (pirin superfamily)
VSLWSAVLDENAEIDYAFDGNRRGFLQVVHGAVSIDGEQLSAGDAVATQGQPVLSLRAIEDSELLLFDMA